MVRPADLNHGLELQCCLRVREEVVVEVLDLEQARLTRCDSLSFAAVFGDLAAWPWPNHCESQSSRGEAHVVMLEHLFPIYRESNFGLRMAGACHMVSNLRVDARFWSGYPKCLRITGGVASKTKIDNRRKT